jgi:adenine deaminase
VVRIIEPITDLVTTALHQAVGFVHTEIKCDPANDILKVAAVDRRHPPKKTAVGLIIG